MENKRNIRLYKIFDYCSAMKIVSIIDSCDTFENLSKCTHVSHSKSGKIIKENLNQNSIQTVKRNGNFFINLN